MWTPTTKLSLLELWACWHFSLSLSTLPRSLSQALMDPLYLGWPNRCQWCWICEVSKCAWTQGETQCLCVCVWMSSIDSLSLAFCINPASMQIRRWCLKRKKDEPPAIWLFNQERERVRERDDDDKKKDTGLYGFVDVNRKYVLKI